MKKLEVDLSPEQVMSLLKEAKKDNRRDYLIFALQFYGECRIGQIVGNRDPRIPGMKPLETEDIREDSIIVDRKGPGRQKVPIPEWLLVELREYVGSRKGRVFDVGADASRLNIRKYAKAAGIPDWKRVHPHRLKWAVARYLKKLGYDPFTIQDMLQHKSPITTKRYVGTIDHEERVEITRKLGELKLAKEAMSR